MKTAVEWLQQEVILQTNLPLNLENVLVFNKLLEQAKEMEKEQIMNAFEAAEKDCGKDFLHGDLYYNETFKSE
jgi:hypothetical protein